MKSEISFEISRWHQMKNFFSANIFNNTHQPRALWKNANLFLWSFSGTQPPMISKQHLTLFFLGEVSTSGETERNKFHWDKTRLDAPVSISLSLAWCYVENWVIHSRHGLFKSSRPEVFCKKILLKISQNSQENTCARVTCARVLSYEFYEISKNTFSSRTSPVAASGSCQLK